jgi:tetratricopeptide (TPR) repeat protein
MSVSERLRLLVLSALGLIAGASPGCTRDDPRELSYRAQADYAAGRPEEAEAALKRLARVRPLTVSERLLRSRTASDRGQIAEALASLDGASVPSRGPDGALIAARRGELEMERHRFRAAEAELKRALVLNPKSIDARRRLIWLYAQQGRSAEVNAESRELAKSASLEFLELTVWTLARHEPLDLVDLSEVLIKVVKEDPGDRQSRLALAEAFRQLGRLDQADATLAALPPAEPEARAVRARVALDRGDSARAEAILSAAAGGESDAASAELRGRLSLGRGDATAAVQHFRAALQADPEDRNAQFGLSQALRLSGQVEAARSYAESARAQDHLIWLVSARSPNRHKDLAALRAIAAACQALGRRDEARGWYQLALRVAPDDAELQKALSQLDKSSSP